MTPEERLALDARLRTELHLALAAGASVDEVVYLLTRMLPELCDRDRAVGHIAAAYETVEIRLPEAVLSTPAAPPKLLSSSPIDIMQAAFPADRRLFIANTLDNLNTAFAKAAAGFRANDFEAVIAAMKEEVDGDALVAVLQDFSRFAEACGFDAPAYQYHAAAFDKGNAS